MVEASQVEAFLLAERRWVSSAEICERFGIKKRALRQIDGQPGLCSEFAVSGDKGYRHIAFATDTEFERWQRRLRTHAIGELVRVRNARRKRKSLLAPKPVPAMTREGQVLLFL